MSPSLRLRLRLGLCALLPLGLAGPLTAQCNAPPVAVADAATTIYDRPLLIDVLANDSDPDGDLLTVSVVSDDCPGTLTAGELGLLTYVPAPASEPVTCEIVYRAYDGTAWSPQVVVSVTFNPVIFTDGFESGDVTAWDQALP